MDFFRNLKKEGKEAEGGYVFLSHSHKDIEKVRKIRNMLEEEGLEPLCFYLKCLSDKKEIDGLIKREIDAREWFFYADSENARTSDWVTMERNYITAQNVKKIITADINDEESIALAVRKLTRGLRVYISHLAKDKLLVERIKKKLQEKDYLVFDPGSISPGIGFEDALSDAISDASKEGCVLALITPDAMKSKWVLLEFRYAIEQGGNVIPVIVGDVTLNEPLLALFGAIQHYCLSETPSDEEIEKMVDAIGQVIVNE